MLHKQTETHSKIDHFCDSHGALTESDLFRDQRGVPTDFLDKVIIFHDQRGIPNDPLGIVIIFCGQGGSQLTFLRK